MYKVEEILRVLRSNRSDEQVEKDEQEILSIINSAEYSGEGASEAIKWYQEKYGCNDDEARQYIVSLSVVNKIDLKYRPGSKGNGCVVTILIVLTTTLASLCFI